MLLAAALALVAVSRAHAAVTPPPTTEGVWNGSPASVPAGASPNVLNDYYYWGDTDFSFLAQAQAKGATPFIELEPWKGGGPGDCQNGLFASIAGNSAAAVSYENAVGAAVKGFGHPVIVTFAHEFNIGGQYPWAQGNSCGVTPAQWIAAWDHVFANVKAAAGGNAFFMWAPNVDPNGNDTVAAKYWPGAANADMTGVDGYPAFCGCGGTFADIFGGTFSEIKALPGFSTLPQTKIFISEIDVSPLDSGGYESVSGFVADLCGDGGDGLLQFQEGTNLSGTQWSELNSALAADCSSGGGTPTPTPTPTATSPTPTPTPTSTGGGTAVALDAAAGSRAANTSSLSWTQPVGTGANRALLVEETIGISSDAACVGSATYDGIAMTQITVVHTNNQRSGAMIVFGLGGNPPSGSDTVHVAVTGCSAGTPAALTGGSESFTGVSQAAPWGAHATAYGSSAQSSVGVASASSDLVGEFVASGSQVGAAASPVTGEFTENQTNNTEAGNSAGGYAPGAPGTVTGGYSLWNDWWGAAAVDVSHA